jgi:crotonobetainyl-CoA:carnitine CoA-transferase CaiB-like acyl-CoA transferase
MALYQRLETGLGQCITLTNMDCYLPYLAPEILEVVMHGRYQPASSFRHPVFAPQGIYRCKGRGNWIALTVSDDMEWQSLVKAMGRPGSCANGQYDDAVSRLRRHDELDVVISSWTKRHTTSEVVKALQAHGVPAAELPIKDGIYRDPHLSQRGFWLKVGKGGGNEGMRPAFLWKMNQASSKAQQQPIRPSDDSAKVLHDLLGR